MLDDERAGIRPASTADVRGGRRSGQAAWLSRVGLWALPLAFLAVFFFLPEAFRGESLQVAAQT
ncbi:MAG TPA: hypothetical protein VMJ64_05490, partial [Anaerolineales bacterium]|nr:hypothetical protein [Anaerolineales bacterium]